MIWWLSSGMTTATFARFGQESTQFSQTVEHCRQRSPSHLPDILRMPCLAMASDSVMKACAGISYS